MKVLVVDDHGMFLDGVKNILKEVDNIDIIHTASSGREAIEVVENHPVDILITDVYMPEMDGEALCRKVSEISPETRTLAVTMHDEYQYISGLLEAGASGYILKNTRQEELIEAINAIYDGKTYYSGEVTNIIANSLSNSPNAKKTAQSAKLTAREIEVVKLIVQEYTTQEIADRLFISLFTVESHRRNIMRRLNVKRVAGVIKFAISTGLVD